MNNLRVFIESRLRFVQHLYDVAKEDGQDASSHYLKGVIAALESVRQEMDSTKEEPAVKAEIPLYHSTKAELPFESLAEREFQREITSFDFIVHERLLDAKTAYDARHTISEEQEKFILSHWYFTAAQQRFFIEHCDKLLMSYTDKTQ